jgi:short-subunit dehydrogenase
MSFNNKAIILTGAAGGLGQILAMQLGRLGTKLLLVDRNAEGLATLCKEIEAVGGIAFAEVNDFQKEDAAETIIANAQAKIGQIDILINAAGLLDFTYFTEQNPLRIAQIMYVNAIVPMLLTRALLPSMLEKNVGQIVNIGSIFGSIGFPHYATYSASKFALRGFSQAIRREVFDTNIKVTYIAPRAIKTPINNDNSALMMAETKTAIDNPAKVATEIIDVIHRAKDEHYIGQPESFFAWLNGFLPKVVSRGLIKPTQIARKYLKKQ